MKNRIMILVLITLFMLPLNAIAETGNVAAADLQSLLVSPMISYQGRLLDSSGNPVDATLSMTFKLYDASTGGNLVWSETKSIVVSKGLFNTNLGSSSALNVANFDQALWLEIVAGTETLTPRQQLLASPYALSLAPGASVKGNQYTPVLTVNNSYGDGIRSISKYGYGVNSDGYYGVYGNGNYGVWGNASSYGLVGQGTYNGLYAYGREGAGIQGYSYNGTAASLSTTNGYYGLSVYQYGKNGGYGVYSYSREGTGVSGTNNNGTAGYFSNEGNWGSGVGAYSREGTGVSGNSYNGTGASFSTSNGYYGLSVDQYGKYGGYGVDAYSKEGTGVYGSSYNGTGGSFYTSNGYYGLSASQYGNKYGYGVYGYSSIGTGVYGGSYSGTGVDGDSYSGTAGSFTSSTGYNPALTADQYGSGTGIDASSKEGYGVYGASYNGTGGYFTSTNGYYGVWGQNNYNKAGYGGVFQGYNGLYAYGSTGYAGYFSGNVYVAGNIYKSGSVSFVEDHPTDPTKQIIYVSLEGGEKGVYVRGSAQLINGEATVELPEHFSLVASQEGLTVQVTPTGETNGLYVVSKSPTEIVVKEIGGGTSGVTFDYLVNGIRKGHENYQAIQDKLPGAPEMTAQENPKRSHQPPEFQVPVEPAAHQTQAEPPAPPAQVEPPIPPAMPEDLPASNGGAAN